MVKLSCKLLVICVLSMARTVAQESELDALSAKVEELHGQGRFDEAVDVAQQALKMAERALRPDHPDVATSLNNLAELYRDQGKYGDAEPLYKQSLAIREKALGPDHPDVATSLNNLAELYRDQGNYGDAEPLYNRSLAIREKALGPDHPDVASSFNNLAELYESQGRYEDVEPLWQQTPLRQPASSVTGFPMDSGVYVGTVESSASVDARKGMPAFSQAWMKAI